MEIQQWVPFALLSNYKILIVISYSCQQDKITLLDLQVKCPIHLFGFKKTRISPQIFV